MHNLKDCFVYWSVFFLIHFLVDVRKLIGFRLFELFDQTNSTRKQLNPISIVLWDVWYIIYTAEMIIW